MYRWIRCMALVPVVCLCMPLWGVAGQEMAVTVLEDG